MKSGGRKNRKQRYETSKWDSEMIKMFQTKFNFKSWVLVIV
jgi:hypothetical protein